MDNLTNSIDQVVEENALPHEWSKEVLAELKGLDCLLYTSPSPRDSCASRMPSSA